MADVYAVFGTLLALGIAFPGMLTAWWLLFPKAVEKARLRLHHTPGRSFGMGLLVTFLAGLPIFILLALPFGPAKFVGAVLGFLTLAFASLGASGLAAEMGSRLRARLGGNPSDAAAFVRAAVALELAAAFPIIGWFVVIPLTIITSLGASTFAILRWTPRTAGGTVPADTAPVQA